MWPALSSISLIPGFHPDFITQPVKSATKSGGGLGTHLPQTTKAGLFAVGSEPIEVEHLLQMALLCCHYNEISTTN